MDTVKYLLDTDICISLLDRREPDKQERILARLDTVAQPDVALSAITVSELSFGVENSRYRKSNAFALDTFLLDFVILSYDESASREAGKVRAELERRDQRLGAMDTLIAAHARSLAATVVTNNVAHFSKVRGLKVENWAT